MNAKAKKPKLNMFHIIGAVLFFVSFFLMIEVDSLGQLVRQFVYYDISVKFSLISEWVVAISSILIAIGILLRSKSLSLVGGIIGGIGWLGILAINIAWFIEQTIIEVIVVYIFLFVSISLTISAYVIGVSMIIKMGKGKVSNRTFIIPGIIVLIFSVLLSLIQFVILHSYRVFIFGWIVLGGAMLLSGIGMLCPNRKERKNPESSSTEMLIQYGEMYKNGIITKEEFDQKKKELLGL